MNAVLNMWTQCQFQRLTEDNMRTLSRLNDLRNIVPQNSVNTPHDIPNRYLCSSCEHKWLFLEVLFKKVKSNEAKGCQALK